MPLWVILGQTAILAGDAPYGLYVQTLVTGAQSVQALVGELVYVDASSGTCPVTPPAVVANAMWGVCDGHHGSPPVPTFDGSEGADVPVGTVFLEDPNAANGNMVVPNTTLHLRQPGQTVIWQGDPTGTYWKLVGG